MSDLREEIEDHVTNAACTGWCDSTMSPNDLVIREATDAIMELIAADKKRLPEYLQKRVDADAAKMMGVDDDIVSAHTDAILSTLTPGSRWTLPDGREMVVVPVEALETMRDDIADGDEGEAWRCLAAMIAAASEPGASAQASDEARDNGRIGDAEHEDDELAQDSERGE